MTESGTQSGAAWRELLDTLRDLDRSFLEGDRAVTDDRHMADGYRMLATGLGVALDSYLFPEPGRPQFVAVNTPFRHDRRWGGDNTDAYYFMCPVDPQRRYRISGNKGDSVYFSLTAYNEPSPGAWSDRVVAIVRDDRPRLRRRRQLLLRARPDARRGRLDDPRLPGRPATGRPVTWHIEALDEPEPLRHGDADTAAALAGRGQLDAHHVRDHAAAGRDARPRRSIARSRHRACWPTNSPIRTRFRTPISAGRRATPATPTAVSCWTMTRRWSSPTGRRRAGSGIWWCGTSSWPLRVSATPAVR